MWPAQGCSPKTSRMQSTAKEWKRFDKLAQRKWAELSKHFSTTHTGGTHVFLLSPTSDNESCHAPLLSIVHASVGNTASSTAPTLVVEDPKQRKRIVSCIHDESHLGMKHTNETAAKKIKVNIGKELFEGAETEG